MTDSTRGLWLGLIGTLAFSVTLPAAKLAVQAFDPMFVGAGRAVVAAVLATGVLLWTRQPLPPVRLLPRLLVVGACVVFGWPYLSAWALQHVPAVHGAVITGILPLATALAATMLAHERPSRLFWLSSLFGSAVVVGFALRAGGGGWQTADWALVGAVAAAAIGYAEGARISHILGGWQTISWALVVICPVALIATWPYVSAGMLDAPTSAWAGFAYVALISQYLGFFAWYKGLALGGIARVGQVQLLQPFLTILVSAWLLGESVTGGTILAAALVVAAVAIGRRAPVALATPLASSKAVAAGPPGS